MSATPPLPLFVNLAGSLVVLTGGGPEARRALGLLHAGGARLRWIAPEPAAERVLPEGCEGEVLEGLATEEQLEGALLLLAASEDPAADAAVLTAASRRGLLACSITGGEARAQLGALRSSGRIGLALTSSGLSPELEGRLADEAARSLAPELDALAEILGDLRGKLQERFPDAERREQIWEQILDSPILALLQAGESDEAAELAERMAWGTG